MDAPAPYHLPVMVKEVEKYLIHNPAGTYVDGTLGGGGHAAYLLEARPGIRIIGLDWDEEAIAEAGGKLARFGGRARIVRENFRNIAPALGGIGQEKVDGVLVDLGVSSRQFDEKNRGFSFQSPVLDMRMDKRLPGTAEDLLNTLDEQALADIFYTLGEERSSRQIARRIVDERKKGRITSGAALASLIERVSRGRGKIHPATRVFQALRIAVNRELENLEIFLDSLPGVLSPGGRAVVLSYHSLEDRIVKRDFKKKADSGEYRVLTKKVVFAADEETRSNPRSRSAKLRCAERI